MKNKVLVSSCLLGKNCKYNGKNNYHSDLVEFLKKYEIIAICPETLGGLSTPRYPSEIQNNRVINKIGVDVTENFILGSKLALNIAQSNNCNIAILKKNSPSCGYGTIYDGTFTSKKIKGNGITAELLFKNGIVILNEDNFDQIDKK